jgi:hypothetical protein
VAAVDDVAVREAQIWGDRDGVQVSARMPVLQTEQSCVMRWVVASVEDFSSRAQIECLQEGGPRGTGLPGDSVRRHWDERGVRKRSPCSSKGLSKVQGRVAVEQGAPRRRAEGGTGPCMGSG